MGQNNITKNTNIQKRAEILLAAVIIARSSSYLLGKLGMEEMGPLTLLGIRFLLAFFFLVLIFHKKMRKGSAVTLRRGFCLGVIFFAVMAAEMFGLQRTDSSTTSFLENTAIVIVPFIEALLRKKPPKLSMLVCAVITLGGIGLLTLEGSRLVIRTGEVLCLLAALLYAIGIVTTDRLSRKDDPLLLGIWEVGFIGLFSMAGAFLFETPHLPAAGGQWAIILALALVCSGFGFTLQPVAQRHVSSEKAGIFCGLTPVTAAVLGRIFLGEQLSWQGMIGAALVLAGMVISNIYTGRKDPDC